MTTPTTIPPDTSTSIAPDNALIINPRDLGITATGSELEKLFIKFTQQNSQNPWQFERSPEGEIITMPPVYHPGGFHENAISSFLFLWTIDYGGESTGSNAAYRMPTTGGILVPDAAWTSPERWSTLSPTSGEPIGLCPDFVAEIRSGSDNLAPLQAKMRLYIQNGALLGWIIDPRNRRVHIYRPGQTEPETLDNPTTLSGETTLPGFTFDVAQWIFDRT